MAYGNCRVTVYHVLAHQAPLYLFLSSFGSLRLLKIFEFYLVSTLVNFIFHLDPHQKESFQHVQSKRFIELNVDFIKPCQKKVFRIVHQYFGHKKHKPLPKHRFQVLGGLDDCSKYKQGQVKSIYTVVTQELKSRCRVNFFKYRDLYFSQAVEKNISEPRVSLDGKHNMNNKHLKCKDHSMQPDVQAQSKHGFFAPKTKDVLCGLGCRSRVSFSN